MKARLLVVLLLSSSFSPLLSHTTSESVSLWQERGHDISATLIISRKEARRVVPADSADAMAKTMLTYSQDKMVLARGSERCKTVSHKALPSANDYIRLERLFRCSKSTTNKPLQLTINLLMDPVPFHTHFARWKTENGRYEYIFRPEKRSQSLQKETSPKTPEPMAYTSIGLEHIVFGYDHLVFLALILLIAGSIKASLWAMTGFTLGHSLSLGLVATDTVRVQSAPVEALIGLTIVLAAGEVVYRGRQLRLFARWVTGALLVLWLATALGLVATVVPALTWFGLAVFIYCYLELRSQKSGSNHYLTLMTVLFGFVHGFGFAGFLIDVGLPANDYLGALFFFNVGIEIGQILIGLGMILGTALVVRIWSVLGTQTVQAALAGLLAAAGSFWFFSRSF